MRNPTPTLADLLEAVRTADLTDPQRRERASAIRTVARALGAEPAEIPLNIKLLRRRLEEARPEALGISRSRWNNVRALLNRALELKTKAMPSAQSSPISPTWRALANGLPRSSWYRMSALLRFLSSGGVSPAEVALADLEAFRDAIIENRLRATPEKTWDGVVWCWNKTVETVPGWPKIVIPRTDKRTVYVRPWSDFPPSYKADVDAYLKVLGGEILDEDGPLRALRPLTLKNRAYQALSAASALVAAGADPQSVRTIADIAHLEPMKLILTNVLHRGGAEHRAGAFNLANFLKAAAQHWVKVDAEELGKIRKIVSKLAPRQHGLTEKNRKRLMPFNDPEVIGKFLRLPITLADEVKTNRRKNVIDAVTAQLAVAISILQAVPMRIANLAGLDLEAHISAHGKKVFVQIPGSEVKNDRPYLMELPKETADLIAWYCREYRDLLLEDRTTQTKALFPNESGAPKKPATLATQISRRVDRYMGTPVNAHLFRHIAAKIYLDRHPGEYALVSRVLNHKSVATTMRAYTGTETISATRHYQNVVAGLRAEEKKPARKRPSR